jgi:putative transposase
LPHSTQRASAPLTDASEPSSTTAASRSLQRRKGHDQSARAQGGGQTAVTPEIKRVHRAHFEVYGVQKVWRQLGREGFSVARCTVARLMRANGIEGAVRGKPLRTTFPDKAAPCPRDHVNREFQTSAPSRLWVSEFSMFVWSHFPSRQAFRLA